MPRFVTSPVLTVYVFLFIEWMNLFTKTNWQELGSCGRLSLEITSDILDSVSLSCHGNQGCQLMEFSITDNDMESAAAVDIVCEGFG